MSLLDVKHQNSAQRLIQRAIARERIPHAYIFHGPDGIGKERLAQGLAELLLCENPIERKDEQGCAVRIGCGACVDCRLMRAGTHPDWHLIHRQLNRDHPDPDIRRRKGLDIGVDVLRHFVIEKVGHTPNRGLAKVFVIREADRITTQAQNALLKTLEEPPGTTFIILLVSSLERLLPTTLSRCQLVGFDVLPTRFVRSELGRLRSKNKPEELDWCARVGAGSIGSSIEALDDGLCAINDELLNTLIDAGGGPSGGSKRPRTLGDADTIKRWTDLAGSLAERYRKRDPDITDTEANRRGLQTLFRLAALWYADLLHVRVGAYDSSDATTSRSEDAEPSGNLFDAEPAPKESTAPLGPSLCNARRLSDLERLATGMDQESAIGRLAQSERQLDLNANVQLVVETLLNDLAIIENGKRIAI